MVEIVWEFLDFLSYKNKIFVVKERVLVVFFIVVYCGFNNLIKSLIDNGEVDVNMKIFFGCILLYVVFF